MWRGVEGTYLIAQVHDVVDVLLRHLSAHGDLGGQFHVSLDFLGEDVGQVGAGHVCAKTCGGKKKEKNYI